MYWLLIGGLHFSPSPTDVAFVVPSDTVKSCPLSALQDLGPNSSDSEGYCFL
jgi:hypothetical protein